MSGGRALTPRPSPARRERGVRQGTATAGAPLLEHELLACWLLGRVPASVMPWPLLRAGRAGRGPGPDVREAAFALPSGVPLAGDVEVHLRATDFVRHGHLEDPAYAGVVLHLCWEDDRPPAERGTATPLPGGGRAPTVVVGAALGGDASRLRALVRRGPAVGDTGAGGAAGGEPCRETAACLGFGGTAALVRREGQRRLAERTWRAAALAAEHGWSGPDGAWPRLLRRALARSAGRRRESPEARAALVARVDAALGAEPLTLLAALAGDGSPRLLIEALRGGGTLGAGRAAEVGWNAALPLLAALAAAYDDLPLARATARLADAWPAPRPYGRTRALANILEVTSRPVDVAGKRVRTGALYAQGLLHLQELWCERGGCGACPLSAPGELPPGASPAG